MTMATGVVPSILTRKYPSLMESGFSSRKTHHCDDWTISLDLRKFLKPGPVPPPIPFMKPFMEMLLALGVPTGLPGSPGHLYTPVLFV